MILNNIAVDVLQKIINGFLSLANSFIAFFFKPLITGINVLFSTFFSGYEEVILPLLSSIQTIINSVIVPSAVWVVNLVPPLTFSVCVLFLGLWLVILEFELTIGIIIKLLVLVKRTIPFV